MKRIHAAVVLLIIFFSSFTYGFTYAAATLPNLAARSTLKVLKADQALPSGLSPEQIKNVYNISSTTPSAKTLATGTIVIVVAYHDENLEKDLGIFNTQFKIPACTIKNKCLEIHRMDAKGATAPSSWSLETSLDTEWSHAIAPKANILVVEAKSSKLPDLMNAIKYAISRKKVRVVSMSWGTSEFSGEQNLEKYFINNASSTLPLFVAASGDDGTGTLWPAVSPHVLAVGGTRVNLSKDGSFLSETAWTGSGGGVSMYETEPDYQKAYAINRANNKRAVPDVSYNADPSSGYAVYDSAAVKNGWYVVGGTSAAPQWAAIAYLSNLKNISTLYHDKDIDGSIYYFRDIISGKNGSCTYYCSARKHYDYVTGLGSPVTVSF